MARTGKPVRDVCAAPFPAGFEGDDYASPKVDPNARKIAVRTATARAEGGTMTVAQVRDYAPFIADEPDNLGGSNLGPTPLKTLLVSLVSCENAMIHGIAKAMRFAYTAVEFECAGEIDIRGSEGVRGIRPYFQQVELGIVIYSDETADRLAKLRKNVELRCPVMNLLKDANVAVRAD